MKNILVWFESSNILQGDHAGHNLLPGVGKDTIKDETTANEQSTDRNQICHSTRKEEHVKIPTYAEVVKSQQQQQRGKTEHESRAEELTLKK